MHVVCLLRGRLFMGCNCYKTLFFSWGNCYKAKASEWCESIWKLAPQGRTSGFQGEEPSANNHLPQTSLFLTMPKPSSPPAWARCSRVYLSLLRTGTAAFLDFTYATLMDICSSSWDFDWQPIPEFGFTQGLTPAPLNLCWLSPHLIKYKSGTTLQLSFSRMCV